MVLKAIDMQVLIPRSNEVGKIRHEQIQHQLIHNHHAEEEMRKINSKKQNSVNKLDYVINDNIRDNLKKKKRDGDEKERIVKTTDEESKVESHLGNILDIQV
ncbi:MAG: hypothetical protein GXW85_01710 [Clostridia bacterium]|nr:hypothetical protein [Clostridia bacterium]